MICVEWLETVGVRRWTLHVGVSLLPVACVLLSRGALLSCALLVSPLFVLGQSFWCLSGVRHAVTIPQNGLS